MLRAETGHVKIDVPRPILRPAALAAPLFAALLIAGCGGGGGDSKPTARPSRLASGTFRAAPSGANRWLPLRPGYQSVMLGGVNRGNRRLQHRRVITVTDVTKEIDGVRTLAVLDQDIDGGQIAEQALDYLAEDRRGTVWYLGSYTEAYEGGQFVNAADAWLAGIDGAKAGILMQASPRAGTPTFVQAKVPGDDPDTAQVVKTGQSKCVPFKCYKQVVVVEEGGSEYKYYAPGVGTIRTEPVSKGGEEETESLINFTRLSSRGLAELSAEAVKLDRHARVEARDTFGRSAPAKRSR
jgi:hypothetical protein